MHDRRRSLALLLAVFSSAAVASDLQPGEYVRERDSGTLTLRRDAQNRLTFEIESIGANCHVCSLSGEMSGSTGRTNHSAAPDDNTTCEIVISQAAGNLLVQPRTEEACRAYCGMRADFDGSYGLPPAECTGPRRQQERDRFLRQYRAGKFGPAVATLTALMARCERYIGWIEIDQIRNDLALAHYHNGEPRQCQETLQATLAAKARNEDELRDGNDNVYLPPCDFDSYQEVAKSTWFNLALCAKASPR